MSEEIKNPYLDKFNECFGSNDPNHYTEYKLVKNTKDFDTLEVEGKPPIDPLDLGYCYKSSMVKEEDSFITMFSIVPFEKDEFSDLTSAGFGPSEHFVVKYQLIGYKHHPGNYSTPPETEDYIIGDYNIQNQALIKALELIHLDDFNRMIEHVSEMEMSKMEKDLEY